MTGDGKSENKNGTRKENTYMSGIVFHTVIKVVLQSKSHFTKASDCRSQFDSPVCNPDCVDHLSGESLPLKGF